MEAQGWLSYLKQVAEIKQQAKRALKHLRQELLSAEKTSADLRGQACPRFIAMLMQVVLLWNLCQSHEHLLGILHYWAQLSPFLSKTWHKGL